MLYTTSRVSCVGIKPNNITLNKTMVDDPRVRSLIGYPTTRYATQDILYLSNAKKLINSSSFAYYCR